MKYRRLIIHKGFALTVHATEDNTTIFNSRIITSPRDMKDIIHKIRCMVTEECAIHKRSVSSMVYEWRVHNLLYTLGIERDRTKDVDLNIGQPWYSKVLYFILSPFYFHFS